MTTNKGREQCTTTELYTKDIEHNFQKKEHSKESTAGPTHGNRVAKNEIKKPHFNNHTLDEKARIVNKGTQKKLLNETTKGQTNEIRKSRKTDRERTMKETRKWERKNEVTDERSKERKEANK